MSLSAAAAQKPWILSDLPPLAPVMPDPVAAGVDEDGTRGASSADLPASSSARPRTLPAASSPPQSRGTSSSRPVAGGGGRGTEAPRAETSWAEAADRVVVDYGPAFLSLEMLLQLSQDLLPLWRESLEAEFPPAEDPAALRALRQQTQELLSESLGDGPARAIIQRMNRLVDGPRSRWEELAVLALLLQQPDDEDGTDAAGARDAA